MVKSVLKRNGFNKYRYIFTGYHSETGEAASFFIELDILNPAVSPESVQSNRYTLEPGFALYSAQPSAIRIIPSYFSIRSGVYGISGLGFESFYPVTLLTASKKELKLISDVCTISDTQICGSVSDPEKGLMSWELHTEKKAGCASIKLKGGFFWDISGIRTLFSGNVRINSDTWIVSPALSNGYIDMMRGKTYPDPFFHLSGSYLQSLISGKLLNTSCFTVQGVCSDTVSVVADFESGVCTQRISYVQKSEKIRYNCTTADAEVHWTVSAENKTFLLDIDVYCDVNQMMLRKYELPFISYSELHVLGGVCGTGEIRLYRRAHKNLELIEHAKLENVYCEYGSIAATN